MEITKEMREELRKPLDAKAISKHPTKTYLSSIKAVYVTERFNDVFGVGSWRTKVEEISCNNTTGMVVVKVIFEIPDYNVYYESYGGNDNGGTGNKNFDLGDAYKGATTDALTKIGSFLEVGIDVFKGLSENNHAQNTSQKRQVTEWLSEDQFKKALEADKKGIAATISAYTSGSRGMKKEYLSQLTAKLKAT